MSTTTTTATTTEVPVAEVCPVCEHALRHHNATSQRFCLATASQGLAQNRRCICSTAGAASY